MLLIPGGHSTVFFIKQLKRLNPVALPSLVRKVPPDTCRLIIVDSVLILSKECMCVYFYSAMYKSHCPHSRRYVLLTMFSST